MLKIKIKFKKKIEKTKKKYRVTVCEVLVEFYMKL